MQPNHIPEIIALLDQAGAAHGRYEESELHGIYDEEWACWYAAYVVEQGLNALLDRPVTAAQVADFFTSTFADYKRDGITENWSVYTVRRLQSEL